MNARLRHLATPPSMLRFIGFGNALRSFVATPRHRNLGCQDCAVAVEEACMPGAGIPLLSAEPEFCVVSRRNDSLGSRWRWGVYASLCILSLGLALGFAALGAWVGVPYFALGMAGGFLALPWVGRAPPGRGGGKGRGGCGLVRRARGGV